MGILYLKNELEEDTLKHVLNQFVIGEIKTAQQDLEFSINQMVEIAVRALSTGVNDPFTAIACIDNLSAALTFLTQAKFPSKFRFDEKGTLRAIADTFDFEGVLDAAFNQIRQSSGGIPAVLIRLLEALTTINEFASTERNRKAIIKHAGMVLRLGKETINEKNDLDDLTERAKMILKR